MTKARKFYFRPRTFGRQNRAILAELLLPSSLLAPSCELSRQPHLMHRFHKKKGILFFFSGLLAFGILYLLWEQIEQLDVSVITQGIRWPVGLAAVFLYFIAIFAKTVRFRYFLKNKIDFKKLLSIVAIHSFWNNLLPFRAGEVSYLYLVRRSKTASDGENITSLLLARVFDFAVLLIFAGASSFLLFSGNLSDYFATRVLMVVGGIIFFIFGLVVLIMRQDFFLHLSKRLYRVLQERGNAILSYPALKLVECFEALSYLRSIKVFIVSLAFSVLVWTGDLLFVWTAFAAAGLSLNPLEAVFITAFPVLAVIVPVQTVAGLGTFEGILTAGLYIVGIEGPQALVASMLLHVQLLLSSFVFFGAAYWFWSRRDKQRRIETHSEFYQALSLPEEDFRNVNLAELLLESAVGHTILDVGCGRGLLLSSAQKKGFEAVGIEPDASIRKLALRQYPNLKIANENVEDFKIEKQFDTVITADVLQCIKDYHRALLSIASFVKPGGRLIVAVPAVPGLFGERDKMMGYLRRYNMKSLSSDINTLGFRIVNTRYWNIASVIPYYVLYKLLRSRTHTMRIRGGNKNGIIATLFSRFLFTWFKRIENRFNFGFGLTAIIIADKVNPSSDF